MTINCLRRSTLQVFQILFTGLPSPEFSLCSDRLGAHKKPTIAQQSRRSAEDRYKVDPLFPPNVTGYTGFLILKVFLNHCFFRPKIEFR